MLQLRAKTIHSNFHNCLPRYSFIQLSELGHNGENENAQSSKRQQSGFEPGLSRLRVRHSTTVLMRSTEVTQMYHFCGIEKTDKIDLFTKIILWGHSSVV